MQQAAAGTEEITTSITSVNQTATETGAAAGQVVDAAQKLSSQSEDLRKDLDELLESVRSA